MHVWKKVLALLLIFLGSSFGYWIVLPSIGFSTSNIDNIPMNNGEIYPIYYKSVNAYTELYSPIFYGSHDCKVQFVCHDEFDYTKDFLISAFSDEDAEIAEYGNTLINKSVDHVIEFYDPLAYLSTKGSSGAYIRYPLTGDIHAEITFSCSSDILPSSKIIETIDIIAIYKGKNSDNIITALNMTIRVNMNNINYNADYDSLTKNYVTLINQTINTERFEFTIIIDTDHSFFNIKDCLLTFAGFLLY